MNKITFKFGLAVLLFGALALQSPNVLAEMAYVPPPQTTAVPPIPVPAAPPPEAAASTTGINAEDVNAAVRSTGVILSNAASLIGTPCGDEGSFGYDRFSHQPLFCTQIHVWSTFGGGHGQITAIDSTGVSQTCDAVCKANGAVCRFVISNEIDNENEGTQVLRQISGPKTATPNYCSSWSGSPGIGTSYPTCICQTQ